MQTAVHVYHDDHQNFQGYLAYDDQSSEKRPAVLVVHDWSGRNTFACQQAEHMAKTGYVGFAVDMYGEGNLGTTIEEKQALIAPLMADRSLVKSRMLAALETVRNLPQVDTKRIAVIGFCFGGLCALDLARSGAPIVAAVSFHGLLQSPPAALIQPINASLLILHGYDDPMVSPEAVNQFCQEMTQANADWQVHLFSQTQHAFMVPDAHNPTLGTMYQPHTAERAWQAVHFFLAEQFKQTS
jgi:dienelactone hydrolase